MKSENSDKQGTVGRRSGGRPTWAVAGLTVAGFLLGVALDAGYRPNHIVFVVQPDTKVTVAPSKGDIIEWKSSNPKSTSTSIRFFSSKVPCSEPNGSQQCTFTPLDEGPQVYLYDCALDQAPSTCYDPGVGPSSSTGAGHASRFVLVLLAIRDFVVTLGTDLERLFRIWPKATKQYWLPGSLSGSTVGGGAPAGSTPGVAAPPRHINVAVDCDKDGKAAVFPDGNPDDENKDINASKGDVITWQPYTTWSISDLAACSPMPLNGKPGDLTGNHLSCTIQGSGRVAYTVKTSCANTNDIKDYINIQ